MASSQDAWYLSLLGLAESFRTSNPPNIKSCIQCLQAVFNFKPPPRVEARTHLQLGNILLTHTKNIELARSHLEKAVSLYFLNSTASALLFCYLSRPFRTQKHTKILTFHRQGFPNLHSYFDNSHHFYISFWGGGGYLLDFCDIRLR